MATEDRHPHVAAVMHLKETGKPGFVVFQLETPRDMIRLVYGGRLFNRGEGSKITFQHSFDNGRTWTTDYTLDGNSRPWDVIKYVTVDQVPAGTRAAQFKYTFASTDPEPNTTGLFNVRMEADYAPPVEARYVEFKVSTPRATAITEVQALDCIKYEPFDLRIALPEK